MIKKLLLGLASGLLVFSITIAVHAASLTLDPSVIGSFYDYKNPSTPDTLANGEFRVGIPDWGKVQGVLEFNLGATLQRATINSALLKLSWYSGSNTAPATNLYAYVGNGIFERNDFDAKSNKLYSRLSTLYNVDVTSFIQSLVNNSSDYAGFLADETNNGAIRNYGSYKLSIDYQPVPVPAAVWLLGTGLIGLLGLRRRIGK
jgi:hypothetical protein